MDILNSQSLADVFTRCDVVLQPMLIPYRVREKVPDERDDDNFDLNELDEFLNSFKIVP